PLSTEDGTVPDNDTDIGVEGRVTVAVERLLTAGAAPARVRACGPNPMMRAGADIAARAAVPCLVSLEGEMACGVGVCLGCPVPAAPGAPRPYLYCCVDGPVFDARDVVVAGVP